MNEKQPDQKIELPNADALAPEIGEFNLKAGSKNPEAGMALKESPPLPPPPPKASRPPLLPRKSVIISLEK
jgi:hypothetical protein